MLNDRQSTILHRLVEIYIDRADPVASSNLAIEFDLSPATIRNEMNQLEKQGYIYQPHTSAGRVPTEDGFKFYLTISDDEKTPSSKEQNELKAAWSDQGLTHCIKSVSKKLAQLSGEAVVVAFNPNDVFYTGISNLICQPEFSDLNLLINFTKLVDQLDEVIINIFDKVDGHAKILIGRDNPFGSNCSAIMASYDRPDHHGIIVLIGPMRMAYRSNIGLINLCKSIIEGKNNIYD